MANLISAATGNFTSAGTWGAVDSASESNSNATSSAVSNSNLDSSTFIPAATVIDGVAVKLAARSASPSGTFKVTLRNSTTSTDKQSVTVNVSDLPAGGLGWVFFKFGATETPNGTDSYVIRVVCSVAGSQVSLFSSSGTNWTRKLRTTTTQAPTTDNHLLITKEMTGTGTSNAITVTMDNTATTSFGPTVSGGPPEGMSISNGGVLTFGTSASTAYVLKWKGTFWITGGGTLNVGTSGTRIPATSTARLIMHCVTNNDTSLYVSGGGVVNMYGPIKTVCTLITADNAVSATSLTVGDTTGWENSDVIAIAGTGQSNGDYDSRIINTVPTGTSCTTTTGLAQPHVNVSLFPAEIVNITQRVSVAGTDSSHCGYVFIANESQVNFQNVEFYYMGGGTGSRRGIDLQQTGAGFATFNKCTFHDWAGNGLPCAILGPAGSAVNTTYTNCGSWFLPNWFCYLSAGMANSLVFDGNYIIYSGTNAFEIYATDFSFTFKNNRMTHQQSNQTSGLQFKGVNGTLIHGWGAAGADNWANNVVHNCNNQGIGFVDTGGLNFNNPWPVWEDFYFKNWLWFANCNPTAGGGLRLMSGSFNDFTFESCRAFGNYSFFSVYGVPYTTISNFRLISCESGGISTTSNVQQQFGLDLNGSSNEVFMENCVFGKTGTGYYTEVTDIQIGGTGLVKIIARNTKLGGTNPIANLSLGNFKGSYVRVNNYGQTAGDHRSFYYMGVVKSDTAIYHADSPSERLTPSTASVKLLSGYATSTVASGSARTFSVWVRKSVVGDGVAYNGNQPRLIVRRCYEGGITAESVVATTSAAAGTWEQLSGSIGVTGDCVLEAYVDCDGTTGWVNVDDWGKSTPPALAYVDAVGAVSLTGVTDLATPAHSHASGNFLLVGVRPQPNQSVVNSITDTAGNTYVAANAAQTHNNSIWQWWYAKNIIGNAVNVVTAHFSASSSGVTISVWQIIGADSASPIDVAFSGNGVNVGFTFSTGSFSTSQNKELIFVAGQTSGGSGVTWSAGLIGGVVPTMVSTEAPTGFSGVEMLLTAAQQSGITAVINYDNDYFYLWDVVSIKSVYKT